MSTLSKHQNHGFLLGFACLMLLVFVAGVQAQDKFSGNTVLNSSPGMTTIVSDVPIGTTEMTVSPQNTDSGIYTQAPCDCCEEAYTGRTRNRVTLRENLSNTACFNCRTNGSYKFPVPRQYTYFWPGIYSQKTMTEYVAPYKGLKLRTPSEVFDSDDDVSEK